MKDYSAVQRVSPELAVKTAGDIPPTIDVSPMFILAAHPARWGVIDGRILPITRKIQLTGGVDGVSQGRDGRWRLSRLRASLEDRGWIVIPHERGPGGQSYMQEIMTRPRRMAQAVSTYIEIWATAFSGSPKIEVDTHAYADWLQGLIDDGTVPTPPSYIRDELIERHSRSLAAAEASVTRGSSSAVAAVAAHRAILEAIAEPRPKSRRAARSTPALPEEG